MLIDYNDIKTYLAQLADMSYDECDLLESKWHLVLASAVSDDQDWIRVVLDTLSNMQR